MTAPAAGRHRRIGSYGPVRRGLVAVGLGELLASPAPERLPEPESPSGPGKCPNRLCHGGVVHTTYLLHRDGPIHEYGPFDCSTCGGTGQTRSH